MFDHLEICSSAVPMYMPELSSKEPGVPQACLKIRVAGSANAEYKNASLMRSGKKPRIVKRSRAKPQGDQEIDLDEIREDARKTYAGTVIVGWSDVCDKSGELVPFTQEHCQEFCEKMPEWIFDQIIVYASTPENFLKAGEQLPPDAEELAKN